MNFYRIAQISTFLLLFACGSLSLACAQSQSEIAALSWKQLPAVPNRSGLAAPFAGTSGGALIVAGGANFPTSPPWEGGQRVWHDSIYVLPNQRAAWLSGFKLSHPIAYGVSVTTAAGVLCIGGSDQGKHFNDVFLLRWDGQKICEQTFPSLPKPVANSCGALVGNIFYLAGGIEKPEATNALHDFWSLDLGKAKPQWRELEPWPGPARMLGVAGVYGDAFYLFSGVALARDATGKPVRRYLKDAYRFTPRKGWELLAEPPRAIAAAPSPAIQYKRQLLFVSGDDGELVDFEPKSQHPGFSKVILSYTPSTDEWREFGKSPLSRATAPVVSWHKMAVIVSGEVRPGIRTPEIWGLDQK